MAETIRNGLYALAVAIVASTIIFSWSLTSAAGTLAEGLAKTGISVAKAPAAPQAPQPTARVAQPTQAAQPQAPRASGRIDLSNAVSKGEDSAKVALVEYSDFECPFCARFFQQTLGQIENDYIKTGRVKFVYKHFPLDSIHPRARKAAQASECARDQGKFFELHDKIFEERVLDVDALKKAAADLGLDATRFNSCLDSGEKDAIVNAHFSEGAQNGIQGTPGFFITDAQGNVLQSVSGAQPYEVFKAALDQALAA